MSTRGERFEARAKRKGSLAEARFCPFCGVADRLGRDEYIPHDGKNRSDGVEFICQVCFRGFRLSISRRVQTANHLFALERKQRPPNDFFANKTITQLAEEQGVKPITDISELTGALPDCDVDEFVDDIYRSRFPRTMVKLDHS